MWALAFDGLAPVLHRLLYSVGNLLLSFALNAISFGHKNFSRRAASCGVAVKRPYGPVFRSVNLRFARVFRAKSRLGELLARVLLLLSPSPHEFALCNPGSR